MYCCNEFYALSILSLYEGELLGKVDKLYFDKKLKKLQGVGLIGEDGAVWFLPTKNIYRVGKNAVTVKNNQMINIVNEEEIKDFASCPINSKVYSITGEYLGAVKDVSLTEKFVTQKLVLDNEKLLDISRLASCGKNTVVFYDDNNKMNVNKFFADKIEKEPSVETNKKIDNPPVETVSVPLNIKPEIQNADFLIGRICIKNIYNFNNEILIKANAVINKKHLKEINKYGRLRELMLYTR